MTWSWLDARPILLCIAGSNGAGKTTFYHSHMASSGLRFVNADHLALELELDAYAAAAVADQLRQELVRQRESFVLETVFSDPNGDKVRFLKEATLLGYTVALCFIGLNDPSLSEQRVAIRISQGGHDVPMDKLITRFPRTLANLQMAITQLPYVIVFDNSDLGKPYRQLAVFEDGGMSPHVSPLPTWFDDLL